MDGGERVDPVPMPDADPRVARAVRRRALQARAQEEGEAQRSLHGRRVPPAIVMARRLRRSSTDGRAASHPSASRFRAGRAASSKRRARRPPAPRRRRTGRRAPAPRRAAPRRACRADAAAAAGRVADVRFRLQRRSCSRRSTRDVKRAALQQALQRSALQRDGRPRHLHRRLLASPIRCPKECSTSSPDVYKTLDGEGAPKPTPRSRRQAGVASGSTPIETPPAGAAPTRRHRHAANSRRMSVEDKTLFVCNCNRTMPLDGAALGRALGLPSPPQRALDDVPARARAVSRQARTGDLARRVHAGAAAAGRRRGRGRPRAGDPLREHPRDRRLVGRGARPRRPRSPRCSRWPRCRTRSPCRA